jgi:hypothetical protein
VLLRYGFLARRREFFADFRNGPDLFLGDLMGPAKNGPIPDSARIRIWFRAVAPDASVEMRLYHPGLAR